ncbi:hypothetical protein OIU85_004979 [Salix viminalis]|uniref:Stress regulated protein n=1 Tax=Salix viminalis TaxID=40686 RepID=A0A9Q0SYC4_SALVM|nr:hypothetical protein OIU85_004979 [Salix viminalis]
MGTIVYCTGLVPPRLRFCSKKIVGSSVGVERQQVLEQLDKGAKSREMKEQHSLSSRICKGSLVGFDVSIPQRLYTLDELKLNGIQTRSLLSPVDATLGAIERSLQIAGVAGGLATWNAFGFSTQQILLFSLGLLFLWTLDSVSFNGGLGSLVLDTIGHTFSQKYHNRVIQHEAGHFLIAYMVGILPRGTAFVDFEFLEEVNTGKVSATTLNRFSCIALAGVAAEYVLFGYAEGGLADINKLDMLIKGLGFTQKKADSQVEMVCPEHYPNAASSRRSQSKTCRGHGNGIICRILHRHHRR